MKNKILKRVATALVLSFSFFAADAAMAKPVFPAKSFRIYTPDSKVIFADLKVNFSVRCQYSSGLFWPTPKSCGNSLQELKVTNDGVIQTPAVETFGGIWNSQKLSNYELSLSVYNGKEFVFSLDARGEDAINQLASLNKIISFLKVNGTTLDVTVNGNPLFGSDLAKVDRASFMLVTFDPDRVDYSKRPAYLMVTMLDGTINALENFLTLNPPNKSLFEASKIQVKDSYFVTEGSLEGRKVGLRAYYSQFQNYEHKDLYSYNQVFPLSSEVLSNLRSINLEPKN